jgi:hypothetical protein
MKLQIITKGSFLTYQFSKKKKKKMQQMDKNNMRDSECNQIFFMYG